VNIRVLSFDRRIWGAAMKSSKIILTAGLLAIACSAGNGAWAHGWGHHHHHGSGFRVGLVVGTGFAAAAYYPYSYYPRYYYPPVYTYPAPVVMVTPPAPPVYIEQQPQQQAPIAAATQPAGYWYYCNNPQGYYPSVQNCPQGWQKVLPQPPSQQ
jgi:hypothetical protein